MQNCVAKSGYGPTRRAAVLKPYVHKAPPS